MMPCRDKDMFQENIYSFNLPRPPLEKDYPPATKTPRIGGPWQFLTQGRYLSQDPAVYQLLSYVKEFFIFTDVTAWIRSYYQN